MRYYDIFFSHGLHLSHSCFTLLPPPHKGHQATGCLQHQQGFLMTGRARLDALQAVHHQRQRRAKQLSTRSVFCLLACFSLLKKTWKTAAIWQKCFKKWFGSYEIKCRCCVYACSRMLLAKSLILVGQTIALARDFGCP